MQVNQARPGFCDASTTYVSTLIYALGTALCAENVRLQIATAGTRGRPAFLRYCQQYAVRQLWFSCRRVEEGWQVGCPTSLIIIGVAKIQASILVFFSGDRCCLKKNSLSFSTLKFISSLSFSHPQFYQYSFLKLNYQLLLQFYTYTPVTCHVSMQALCQNQTLK